MASQQVQSDIRLLDESGTVLFETQHTEEIDTSSENLDTDAYIAGLQSKIPELIQASLMEQAANDPLGVGEKMSKVKQLQLRFHLNKQVIEHTVPLAL